MHKLINTDNTLGAAGQESKGDPNVIAGTNFQHGLVSQGLARETGILHITVKRVVDVLQSGKLRIRRWLAAHAGPEASAPDYAGSEQEEERFSPDADWMPRTVMIAKSTLVWMEQLARRYAREVTRLDHVPDEELDRLAAFGINALWLIGVWERSPASRRRRPS